ncbi:HWE histidine kinase domain-containing protein [Alteriqipengyuania sp. WL0013]|uniref:sensor histidine kinase n=1 Tax=Alteriqipengyuania sp. WL0013 TaxID=3110773 RepID=UPI002C9E5811|nr:HWE histidine kinase domain-containing protein [Alteriqipengyuania sp. WL0013]MEB3416088.1 HWE histidine kinase domain-containing protein [Alteriqipengyuania sp. WL0013]
MEFRKKFAYTAAPKDMKKPDFIPWPIGAAPDAAMCGEDSRAQVLAQYGLDQLQDDGELERVARFAAKLCDAPIALVTVVEKERQRFLATEGIDERETPRPTSFCAHAMLGAEPLEIPDAAEDERFSDNPLVTGQPGIRFYAGHPLVSTEGAPIGALCIIDTKPRPGGLTDFQREGLAVLGGSVMRRLLANRLERLSQASYQRREKRLRQILDSVPGIAWSADADLDFDYFNARYSEFVGRESPRGIDDWAEVIHKDDWPAARQNFLDAIERGEQNDDQFRLRMADGSWRWMVSRAVPLPIEDGSVRWVGTIFDIDDAHKVHEARELLANELSHRIKNIFAVISGLIALSARKLPDHSEFASELTGKIRALGKAHDIVRPEGIVNGASLKSLLEGIFAPYTDDGQPRVVISGDDVPVGSRAATPLALVFHELATNSAKYGVLSRQQGDVSLSIAEQDGALLLRWRESDVPQPEDAEAGFGSRLLTMSVEGQLRGLIERRWADGGMTVELTVPVDAITG